MYFLSNFNWYLPSRFTLKNDHIYVDYFIVSYVDLKNAIFYGNICVELFLKRIDEKIYFINK